jgi:hypothetical protein
MKWICGKCGRENMPGESWYWNGGKEAWCHRICPKRKRRKKALRLRIKGVDIEATKARKFKHPKSRVMLDGREILYEEDYDVRKLEVERRDKHKCQWVRWQGVIPDSPEICGAPSTGQPHHIVSRSDGRDDRASNLMAICDVHHKIAHPEKQPRWTASKESENSTQGE